MSSVSNRQWFRSPRAVDEQLVTVVGAGVNDEAFRLCAELERLAEMEHAEFAR
jgi:hypothetical protein